VYLNPLLHSKKARFGVDGAAISTHRDSDYLKSRIKEQVRHFYKIDSIPTKSISPYAPKSKIVMSNPTVTGIDFLKDNMRLLGKHYISGLELYCLIQFKTRMEAEVFKKEFTSYLQRDRSLSTVLFDSDAAVGKAIPEHCYPGETFYCNSKSGKRTDIVYVSNDKLDLDRWVCKIEIRMKSATEVKRLTGIACMAHLAQVVADQQQIKQIMERLLVGVYPAQIDRDKLARWLARTRGKKAATPLRVNLFLRQVAYGATEREDGQPVPPSALELDSYALFKLGMNRMKAQIKSAAGRKSKYAEALLALDISKFKKKL
jgi:hypothetical protein